MRLPDELASAAGLVDDHPDSVRQLRRLVIALAISGRLTERRECEAASEELLRQLDARHQKLVLDGKLARAPLLREIAEADLPDACPAGPLYLRLGDMAWIEKGRTGIASAKPGPYPLVVTGRDRARCDHFDFDVAAAIVPLVSSAGHGKASIQRLHYQEGKFALGTILAAVVPHAPDLLSARFVFEYLTSFKNELLVSQMIGTANVTLTIGKVANIPIPLVAPEVQQRVDELMALCDRLEAARAEREAARDRLAAASLARLNTPDPETFADDARFALDALPAFSTRPDQIAQLRQTIQTLAVRGLLQHQTLSANCNGQSQLRSESGLPSEWRWVRTEEVCEVIVDCPHSTPKFVPSGVVCLDTNAFKGGAIVPSKIRYVAEEDYEVRTKRLVPRPGDVVFAREGSVGESVIIPAGMRCCLGQRVMLFRPSALLDSTYFQLALSEPSSLIRLLALHKGIGAKHVNVADMRRALIPFPPIADQKQIVAKVHELMALCNQLEASLNTATEHRSRLLDALLRDALASGHQANTSSAVDEVATA